MAKGIKTGGRTKGTQNKSTAEIREHFQKLVTDNLEQLDSDLKSLEPLQRLKMVIEISKFIVPTLKNMDVTANDMTPITISFIETDEIKSLNAELEARY